MTVVYGVVALRERGIRGVLAVYCIVLYCIGGVRGVIKYVLLYSGLINVIPYLEVR